MFNLGDRVRHREFGLDGYVVALAGQPRGKGFDNPSDVVYNGKVGVRFDSPYKSIQYRESLYWLISITNLEVIRAADRVEDWLE